VSVCVCVYGYVPHIKLKKIESWPQNSGLSHGTHLKGATNCSVGLPFVCHIYYHKKLGQHGKTKRNFFNYIFHFLHTLRIRNGVPIKMTKNCLLAARRSDCEPNVLIYPIVQLIDNNLAIALSAFPLISSRLFVFFFSCSFSSWRCPLWLGD